MQFPRAHLHWYARCGWWLSCFFAKLMLFSVLQKIEATEVAGSVFYHYELRTLVASMIANETLWPLYKFHHHSASGKLDDIQSGSWWRDTEAKVSQDCPGLICHTDLRVLISDSLQGLACSH